MLLKSEDKKKSDGEVVVRKSAFDILEDFINREEIVKQNMAAQLSETVMNVVEPKIINISEKDVIFNAPVIDEEFEALKADELASAETADQEFYNLQQEAMELEKALDLAFEQLTGEKLTEEEFDLSNLNSINDLDFSVDQAILKGKEFDLDLSFLNEVSVPTTEIEGE